LIAPAPLAGMGLAVFLRRARLLDAPRRNRVGSPPASRNRRRPSVSALLVADHQLFVDAAQDLANGRGGPQIEEGAGLERRELLHAAIPGLVLRLAGARGLLMAPDAVLVVDGGVLDVAVELLEVLGVEDGRGQRRPLRPVLLVEELQHEVVVR